MPSAPGQDQPAGPAAPGVSRAGQVAVVTGGSAGLGLAIAAALAQAGTTVVLASRSAGRCADAAARLSARTGTAVHGRACDVTSERAVGALTEAVLAGHGRIDVLVTSAGIQARGTVDQLAVADLRACLEVNVVGTWLACRAAAAPMRAAGYGRILTLASALGLAGAAARSGYAASKGAVVQLTRSLAARAGRHRDHRQRPGPRPVPHPAQRRHRRRPAGPPLPGRRDPGRPLGRARRDRRRRPAPHRPRLQLPHRRHPARRRRLDRPLNPPDPAATGHARRPQFVELHPVGGAEECVRWMPR
jgi:NAD(P)-dependent dehydrogenase (short-subunit alcohol dehydrogenase family)